MSKKSEEKIIKETKYCKIISQGKVGEGEYTYSIEKIYIKELKRDEVMFKKDNRYVTRGVNEEVDIRIQMIIWSMIDNLKGKGNIELDYLQVFKLRKEGNKIVINQSQEVPEYSCTYEIEVEDVQLDDEIKVYVIDSGEYSTMLFPSQY